MIQHETRLRRALRRFNLFTLMTFNPEPYRNPYSDQSTRALNGPRVF